MRYSEESIVARVFEYDARFADEFGYVQDWKVLRHFFGESHRKPDRLGFSCGVLDTGYVPFKRRYPDIAITRDMLDELWSEFVEDPPGDWRIQYRHESKWLREARARLEKLPRLKLEKNQHSVSPGKGLRGLFRSLRSAAGTG